MAQNTPTTGSPTFYNKYLLLIAGLGGLLYGIDVGIIAGALPYLEATSGYTPGQLSTVVAAVLLGSFFSSLFAGLLADLFGRKAIMLLSAVLFVASIPIITLSQGINMLIAGRLLQGISGGLIGVVIPLYLAECLGANSRGKGTGMFQLMLTVGLVASAFIGLFFASQVGKLEEIVGIDPATIFSAKDNAWRMIFWVSIAPGIAFLVGAFFVSESPRWLFRKGRKDDALAALTRSSGQQGAQVILEEMKQADATATDKRSTSPTDSLLQRKYVLPFVLALITLACTQATGVNSVLAYAVNIFQQAGLTGKIGNQGNVLLTIVNCVMTVVAVALVDKKGRTFLLKMGTAGIIVALLGAATTFLGIESKRVDIREKVESSLDQANRSFRLDLRDPALASVFDSAIPSTSSPNGTQVVVSYKYGPYTNVKYVAAHTGSHTPAVIEITPPKYDELKDNIIGEFFRKLHLNPFADMTQAEGKPLEIVSVKYGAIPGQGTGWMVAGCFILFIASFASGPGVCVWLALSELMPTRIRSNGMSIALMVNQGVSATIAAVFLPTVGSYGYSTMFFFWAGCTVIYFITAAFFLPETKGKTLEEIEEHFEGKKSKAA
ncbi:sugar porter family MFS transporter [Luteolibacter flavescens]|uniref:Sugar porter family MFS transporter n=1 Tax=Luteolibacter flavescens TaxID=1859460 RepID=A0ABT3FU61_9BACT|nr:sugar porter family MFS transporter [Luteolibacter flavescens]MCW1886829.1 sugar porter family MFS transporter [Luteolibacter flavescens]